MSLVILFTYLNIPIIIGGIPFLAILIMFADFVHKELES